MSNYVMDIRNLRASAGSIRQALGRETVLPACLQKIEF